MNQNKPRRLETDFPLRKVSEESVREKNIRQGHISTPRASRTLLQNSGRTKSPRSSVT